MDWSWYEITKQIGKVIKYYVCNDGKTALFRCDPRYPSHPCFFHYVLLISSQFYSYDSSRIFTIRKIDVLCTLDTFSMKYIFIFLLTCDLLAVF